MKAPLEMPALHTERFTLRPLTKQDATVLTELTNHKDITEVVHFLPTPFTRADADALLDVTREEGGQFLGVCFHGNVSLVAVIGVHPRGDDQVEIGYWVHPAQYRRGIAYEAVSAALEALTHNVPQRQIIAECRAENRPSWQLLEKLGFVATGEYGLRPGRHVFVWRDHSA
ncbi:GNAT family N-acetyltransferase [Saccharibacter floricola]|uniref:Acetyltransferase n=1 Tax=Saccharibacter floricola DSM 15669 TaxID=1123227 RepID=A0ABQ0NYS7_9PROT|nr:GNAT family N-acetyltransferase [Saccharibacter floricola]GBQ06599.1 acetyltransferase [Saccharibacter floricola DSM 15669]